jgi:hypothetical protein
MPAPRMVSGVLALAATLHFFAASKLLAQPFGPPIELPLTWLLPKPTPPRAPFVLTLGEQRSIDAILARWEKSSAAVKSFSCRFTRWDYDLTFGPKKYDFLMSERHGVLKFRSPDSGLFRENSMKLFDPVKDKYVDSHNGLEKLSCDGKFLYWLQPR